MPRVQNEIRLKATVEDGISGSGDAATQYVVFDYADVAELDGRKAGYSVIAECDNGRQLRISLYELVSHTCVPPAWRVELRKFENVAQ